MLCYKQNEPLEWFKNFKSGKLMKRLLYLFSCLLILMAFKGDNSDVDWYGWNEGYPKGIEEDKIILVDAYTDWCGWCKKMDKTTYSNEEVVQVIEENFIPIKFNPEEKNKTYKIDGNEVKGQKLFQILTQGKRAGFPTTFFLFPESRTIRMVSGYKGPQDFKKVLNNMRSVRAGANTQEDQENQ